MDEGVYYIAIGQEHVKEAKVSARSLKEHNPEVNIAIKTDQDIESELFDEKINTRQEFSWDFRIKSLKESPFERTLFLDTDTLILDNLNEVFKLIGEFDVVAAQNPVRIQYDFDEIPRSFPEFNCGVVGYRNSKIKDFIDRWAEMYNQSHPHDQPAFRKVLYESEIRFSVLPSEYNCRTAIPGFLGSDAKIIHDRLLDFETVGRSKTVDIDQEIAKLNDKSGLRVHWREGNKLKVKKNRKPIKYQVIDGLEEYGLVDSLVRGVKKIAGRLK